ncbi:MAG: T9SS type A sorting domain-containing protein [Candidatus Zixiibacteriota bacterium]|nr:MAG: T9SS type A sorting domain-containing protein [candidate division Zixibacteria bacterium]
MADPNGDIHLAIEMILDPSEESYEIYHCWYDVFYEEWSELEIVSEISEPDGNNSILPYLAFREVTNGYKMYVVWEEAIPESLEKQVKLRIYESNSNSWDTEILIADKYAEEPCVAVQTNGDIYVVWEDIINDVQWIYYKWFNNSSSTWSSMQAVTDNEDLNWLSEPTIICDRWDNLHLAACGEVDSLDPSSYAYEVFYSFWDAPPHAPQNLAQVFSGPPEYITITWDANSEPDMDGYMIIRRYHEKTELDTLATVDDTVTTYVDTDIPHVGGETENYVRYWIEAIDTAGQHSPKSDSLECAVPNNWEPPKLFADGSIPTRFALMGNYPNPFNATTEIRYALPFNAHVILEIYDILGRKTAVLIDEYQEAGYKTVHWNGLGDNGMEVSTGIYIYRLSSAGLSQSKRMLLLK